MRMVVRMRETRVSKEVAGLARNNLEFGLQVLARLGRQPLARVNAMSPDPVPQGTCRSCINSWDDDSCLPSSALV